MVGIYCAPRETSNETQGQGWIEYDHFVSQHAGCNESKLPCWSHSFHHLGGQSPGTGTFCTLCQECDHSSVQCALT